MLAQQSMAASTESMKNAAWVGILLSTIGVYLIGRTMLYTADAAKYAKSAAEATEVAAEQAREATRISTETLHETRLIGERQLRAYMYVEPGPLKLGETLFIKIVQGNVGLTQAIDAQFFAHAEVRSHTTLADIKFPRIAKTPGTNVVNPGRSFSVLISCDQITKTYDFKRITGKNAERRLYVYCQIAYTDVYRTRHVTRACWSYVFSMTDVDRMKAGWFTSEFDYTEQHNCAYSKRNAGRQELDELPD